MMEFIYTSVQVYKAHLHQGECKCITHDFMPCKNSAKICNFYFGGRELGFPKISQFFW